MLPMAPAAAAAVPVAPPAADTLPGAPAAETEATAEETEATAAGEEEAKKRGKPVAIFIKGPMGAGKTTLAKHITRHSALPGGWMRQSFAAALREAVERFTDHRVAAAATVSNEEKARLLPAGALPANVGQALARLRAAFGPVVGLAALPSRSVWLSALERFYHAPAGALRDAVDDTPLPPADAGPPHSPMSEDVRTITVGRLLQLLGTEVGRGVFGGRVWVDVVRARWRAAGSPNLLNDDLRFDEEAAFGKEIDALVVAIDADARLAQSRDGATAAAGAAPRALDGRSAAHASETSARGLAYDVLLDNNADEASFVREIYNCGPLVALAKLAPSRPVSAPAK